MSSKTFRIFQNKMVLLFLIIALFMLSGCAPLITDFTPDRGPVGTEVTIKGENFFWIQYVKFEEGRTENFDSHFRLFSEDWIDTKVSYGATTGKIRVRNIFGTGVSANDFIVEKETWSKSYGGTATDTARSIQQTTDGGYIVAGYTTSLGEVNGDFWVLKLDGSGDIIWQKTYGGTDFENALSIQQTTDEGYIVAGFTVSFGTSGSHDFWILKLDGNGDIIWQKTYGGSYAETALSIQQTTDEGYIVAGTTVSFGVARSVDFWVLKLDEHGNISESCPPEIGQNTSAIPADTSVVPQDTLATVTTSSSTITSTTVTPADTNATIETQCTN